MPDQIRQIKAKIEALKPDYVLNVSEEDLVQSLTSEFTLDTPVLDQEGIHVDYGEHKVDVSRDPMRFIDDPSRPYYVPGTRVTFIVPFGGDPELLHIRPQQFAYSLGGSQIDVVGGEIHITYAGTNLNAQRAKASFDGELRQLVQNLANLRATIDRHNSGLAQVIRTHFQQRKSKLLADAKLAADIGFPIKRRDGVPATYAVPVQRRKPAIERPVVASGPFQPEPRLAMAEYDAILGIIRNMVRVMEQSPKAFEKMGEEDLRTHFLVQLNGQYEGRDRRDLQFSGEDGHFDSRGRPERFYRRMQILGGGKAISGNHRSSALLPELARHQSGRTDLQPERQFQRSSEED